MLQPRSIQSSLGIRDKILSFDFILIFAILVLGVTSMFAMYSTDGGEFKYHTNSHILRFFVFFVMFLIVSLISIRFWHETSYLIYVGFFILFWFNFLRIKKVVRSLFYESTALRAYESRINFISC